MPSATPPTTLDTLASFNRSTGAHPYAGLIADASGDLFGTTYLYGTTYQGGPLGYGTVFEITNTNGVYGTPTVLATFNQSDGARPVAGLIADASGDLFGTTRDGGASNVGTVFEITKTNGVYGTPTVLASFNGSDGAYPYAGLIADASGDLFGTTYQGGASFAGTVFEITKTNGVYGTPTVLASFNFSSGDLPLAGLIADASGDLFGTTGNGGASRVGTVFEITKTNGVYGTPTVLASFNGYDGARPEAGLIADGSGDLFGTTEGGGASNDGTVFEITKTNGVYGTPIVLASFNGSNGQYPVASLIADASGDLFGTTEYGGASDYGTVFEITKTNGVYGTPTVLASFNGSNDQYPSAGLIADGSGDLFGTTYEHGANGYGAVFVLTRPPTVAITSASEASNQATQTIAGTVTSGGSASVANQAVTFTDNGMTLNTSAPVTTDGNGHFTAQVVLPNQGANSIVASSQDSYGNAGLSSALVDTLDSVAPAVAITSASEASNQAMQTITGTVTSGGSASVANQAVTFTDNGAALATSAPVTTDLNGNFSAQVTLAQGSNAIVAASQDSYGNTGTSPAVIDTLDSVPPTVAFDPAVSFSSPTNVSFTGTVSDNVGVSGVELFEGAADLGAATLKGDGTWSFTTDLARGFHTGLVAVATDTSGNSASAPSDFDLTTGLKSPVPGQPYTAIQDSYDPGGNFLGQTFFKRHGAVLFSSSFAALPDGGLSYTYSGGSFFDDKPYSSFTDNYTAPGIPAVEILDNNDGSHTITAEEGGVRLHSIGSDTMIGAGSSDRFVFSRGFGQDTITDFVAGGPAHDTLVLPNADAARLAQILASAHSDSGATTLHIDRQDSITLQGITLAELKAHPNDFRFHA